MYCKSIKNGHYSKNVMMTSSLTPQNDVYNGYQQITLMKKISPCFYQTNVFERTETKTEVESLSMYMKV